MVNPYTTKLNHYALFEKMLAVRISLKIVSWSAQSETIQVEFSGWFVGQKFYQR